jgi:hypothetical protein
MPDLRPVSWERMIRAVEKVRERLLRAASALETAGVPYAVTGENAVAAWVSCIDEAAVRNTRYVDLLVRRADFGDLRTALEAAGCVYRHSAGIETFLDKPGATARDSVRVLFARETIRPEQVLPTPDVEDSELVSGHRVLSLEALVQMELMAVRAENGMHVRDLIDVGLVDDSWPARVPEPLRDQLRELLEDRDG